MPVKVNRQYEISLEATTAALCDINRNTSGVSPVDTRMIANSNWNSSTFWSKSRSYCIIKFSFGIPRRSSWKLLSLWCLLNFIPMTLMPFLFVIFAFATNFITDTLYTPNSARSRRGASRIRYSWKLSDYNLACLRIFVKIVVCWSLRRYVSRTM